MVDSDDGQPPPELILAWQCERWNALPVDGGLYDQDYRTLFLMDIYSKVHMVVSRLRSMKGAEIHNLTKGERKIIGGLRKDGVL